MKKYLWYMLVFLSTSASALAQEPVNPAMPPPSPTEQALTQRLMQEIGNGINCSSSAITLQRQLADAQAQVKKLEAKVAELSAKAAPK